MKIVFIHILVILFSATCLANDLLEKLVPRPRQAYVREHYSAAFDLNSQTPLMINPDMECLDEALAFNRMMRERGRDTLEIRTWTEADTNSHGIFLGADEPFLNKLLDMIPDQKIEVNKDYPGSEGYVLDVLHRVIIAGSDRPGLYFGITTFFQLVDINSPNSFLFFSRIVDAPEFPVRWFFYMMNFQSPGQIGPAKSVCDSASYYKLNGFAVADSKFSRPTTLIQRYYDSLMSVHAYTQERNLEFIPCIMPFGYSNSLLFHDPNLASGLPVKAQKFYIEGDTGRLVPDVDVSLSNGGFEQYNGNTFPGFGYIDNPGTQSFVDTDIVHSGNASLRFDNFDGSNARITYWTPVSKFTTYHVQAWVRTENLQPGWFPVITVYDKGINTIYFETPHVPNTTNGWQKVDICFNSLDNDTVGIYWGVWGPTGGKIWWDDLMVEETAFVNLLRRPGTPLDVSHPFLDIGYEEGRDYDTLIDPLTGNIKWPGDYNSYHSPPVFRVKPDGNINEGDTLNISYYHAVIIHEGQVMITMSDPKVYEIAEREFRFLDSLLDADTYFMQHDEIRTMNWDFGDMLRQMTPGEILADNVNKCQDIINRNAPGSDIWVWSDMFDEYHNAVEGNYYLVNGDLRGSADLISNDIGIANWNGRETNGIVNNSLRFFQDKDFRQISAPYYDKDENQIRRWKEWTQNTDKFKGMMYTTWQSKYEHLRHFAYYAWNHAPFLYHHPPAFSKEPNGEFPIFLTVKGDQYDNEWELENVMLLYRTDRDYRFTGIELEADSNGNVSYALNLPEDNQVLEYYFTAADNKGWISRIPYGVDHYYVYGDLYTSIDDHTNTRGFDFELTPNPVMSNGRLFLSFGEVPNRSINIIFYNLLGIRLKEINIDGTKREILLDITSFPCGVYLVCVRAGDAYLTKKIIIE